MKELAVLEKWVRSVAVPVLVTGTSHLPPIRPQMETSIGWENVRDVLNAAGEVPAAQRSLNRITAHLGRESLAEILPLHPNAPERSVIQQWVERLTDDEVIKQVNALTAASQKGPFATMTACGDMLCQVADTADKG